MESKAQLIEKWNEYSEIIFLNRRRIQCCDDIKIKELQGVIDDLEKELRIIECKLYLE
jgi:hypothetical protein